MHQNKAKITAVSIPTHKTRRSISYREAMSMLSGMVFCNTGIHPSIRVCREWPAQEAPPLIDT